MQKFISISACLQHINMHMITLLDVFLVLRNPFFPNRKRIRLYIPWLLATQVVITIVFLATEVQDKWIFTFFVNTFQKRLQIIAIVIAVFYLITFLIFFWTLFRLTQKGPSIQLRRMISIRHGLTFVCFSILVADSILRCSLIINIYDIKSNEENFEIGELYAYFSLFELVGLPLALIRMWEPYVRESFKQDFMRCCRSKKKSKLKYKSMSLNLFLNSAINIELVYIILSRITNFLENLAIVESDEQFDDRESRIVFEHYNRQTRLVLHEIKFENANGKWDLKDKSVAGKTSNNGSNSQIGDGSMKMPAFKIEKT